jgi:hypothetical protein
MKNYTIFYMTLLLPGLILGACKPTQAPVNIINLNEAQGIRKYMAFYTLPKTVIRVNIKLERITSKKGPYSNYAQSLLGLTDVITEDSQKWAISDINFRTYAMPDTTQLYLIEPNSAIGNLEVEFTPDGFLSSINRGESNHQEYRLSDENQDNWEKRNNIQQKLVPDRPLTFDDVQLPKELYAKKSVAEEAAFLAGKILTLRDDRTATLIGDGYTEIVPEGNALKFMINSIDSLQEKYLSMFRGKCVKDYFYYSFEFIPVEPRKKTQVILFRFSEQFGIVDNNDVSGMPMIFELESFENLKAYEMFKKKQGILIKLANKKGKEVEKEKGIFFRVPEEVNARIIANDMVLQQEKIQIAQFGSIHALPVNYLDGSYAIEFYPKLGSVRSIVKKEALNLEKKNK